MCQVLSRSGCTRVLCQNAYRCMLYRNALYFLSFSFSTHESIDQQIVVCCSVLQCGMCEILLTPKVLQGVAVCCSVLQCVAVCCSVLQCVAVCCSWHTLQILLTPKVLQCVAVCCSVLQCVAVCCSVLQCVAVCCNVECVKYVSQCESSHRVVMCFGKVLQVWHGWCVCVIWLVDVCDCLVHCQISLSVTNTDRQTHSHPLFSLLSFL